MEEEIDFSKKYIMDGHSNLSDGEYVLEFILDTATGMPKMNLLGSVWEFTDLKKTQN